MMEQVGLDIFEELVGLDTFKEQVGVRCISRRLVLYEITYLNNKEISSETIIKAVIIQCRLPLTFTKHCCTTNYRSHHWMDALMNLYKYLQGCFSIHRRLQGNLFMYIIFLHRLNWTGNSF